MYLSISKHPLSIFLIFEENLPFCHKKPSGINLAYIIIKPSLTSCLFFLTTPPQYLAYFYHFCEKIITLCFSTHRTKV
jgi:hypothetical protein